MNSVEIIQLLLKNRGIEGDEEISEFLSPKPKKTYNPFLLHNMREGVDLLLDTIRDGGNVCIYGDYDSDGITSVCILKTVLSQLVGKEVPHYIPSRFDEGYGLNRDAVKTISESGTSLIITVDCGSTSFDEVEYAKELGLHVIVTDHHDLGEKPANCILINPKQTQCNYPFKELSGCGVAFKFAQGIVESTDLDKGVMNRCLDLVALGTIGDIVPLVDENRTLVKYGLNLLNQKKRMGLRILGEKIFRNREIITSEDVAYGIVPHINAAGRMESGNLGVDLLMCQEEEQCEELTDQLIDLNNERKRIQQETVDRCLQIVEERFSDSYFPIIKAEDAHEGIIGIVAGRVKDALNRPVAVVTVANGLLKGSARSIENIDIIQLMSSHGELMEKLGGHKGACGFSLEEDNLEELRKRLQEDLEEKISEDPDLFLQKELFEMTLSEENITLDLANAITEMEPFGSHNPRPHFQIEGVYPSYPKKLGEKGNHARFFANFPEGHKVKSILFSEAEKYEDLIFGNTPVTMRGQLTVHRWQGREELQLTVEEMVRGKNYEYK